MVFLNYEPPEHQGLDILFQDETLLVANKPAGLLSVPGRGEDKLDSLASRVQSEYPSALIVHRLDMETSGLMVLALNRDMHRQLSNLFQARNIRKQYIAIVNGLVKEAQGNIELPLIGDWPNRPRQKVDFVSGKVSTTRYQLIARDRHTNTSRVKLQPVTGRSHQLRVHMHAIGHPISGDKLYGTDTDKPPSERLSLHAESLEFIHPTTAIPVYITSLVPF